MLHAKKSKSLTIRENYAELTGISNEEIISTFLNILKYRYNTIETNR